MEPEEYSRLLKRLRQTANSIVRRFRGETIRIDGDGFLFMFGYPVSEADATRNALGATLALHDAVDAIGADLGLQDVKLRLHSGINAGVVLLQEGDVVLGRYEIIGDPTNVAARLCDFAQPGEIVISETALGANRHQFETSGSLQISLSGRQDVIEVRKVYGWQPAMDGGATSRVSLRGKFVGRESELQKMLEFAVSNSGGPALAVVIGEAGIGKSRLISEFQAIAQDRGQLVLWSICDPYIESAPLQPFRTLSNSILESCDGSTLSGEARRLIAEFVMPSFSVQGRDGFPQLAEAFLSVLRNASGDGNAILVIDDWHWADDLTRALVDQVLRSAHGAGIRFLLASRTEPGLVSSVVAPQLIKLEPLNDELTQSAIASKMTLADPQMIRELSELSGGNPLYIDELCHAAERGETSLRQIRKESWLHTLTGARFASLDAQAAEVLRVAAVLGFVVPKGLLCDVCGMPGDAACFKRLEDADFLFPGQSPGTLIFKHGLTQQSIYNLIGFEERRSLHRKVVDELLRKGMPEDRQDGHGPLALHYAGAGEPGLAVRHAMLAGQIALSSAALDKAQKLFRFALAEYYKDRENKEDIVRLLHLMGLASIVDPSHEQVVEFGKAVDWASARDLPRAVAWGEYWKAFILYGIGEPRRSLASFLSAKAKAEALGDQQLETRVEGTIGQVFAAACDYEQAVPTIRRAIDMQQNHFRRSQNPSALAYSLACLGFTLADQGRFSESNALFGQVKQALAGREHEVLNSVYTYQGAALTWQGRLDDAAEVLESAIEIAGRMRSRYIYAKCRALLAVNEFYRGARVETLDDVALIAGSMSAASRQRMSIVHGFLAEAYAQGGFVARARQHAARTLLRARKGDRLGEAQAYRALAILAGMRTDDTSVARYLSLAEGAAEHRKSAREQALNDYLRGALTNRRDWPGRALEGGPDPRLFYPHLEAGLQQARKEDQSDS